MSKLPLKIRIPTDQYAFVEIDVEIDNISETKEKYNEVKSMFETRSGLPESEWKVQLDKYLTENTLSSEEYNKMSDTQQMIIQEIKKSIKRLNYNKTI